MTERDPRAFATTDWSLVVRAGAVDAADRREALQLLCQTYWYPLYWYSRRIGLKQHDAEDLIQAFFEDLLERGAIAKADASRGRFRSFLLSSLRNFHSHQRGHARSLKRGGGWSPVTIEAIGEAEMRFLGELTNEISPEKLYDKKWALSLLDAALARLGREYVAARKQDWFNELKVILWGGGGEVSYAIVAGRLDSTEGAVKVAVHRLRLRFRECLRDEVARTVLNPADVEDEMRHMLAAVSL